MDDPYDPDHSKILTSEALTKIINSTKKMVNHIKNIIDQRKYITKNITRTINRFDQIEEKIYEQKYQKVRTSE
jgi:hypothetical protein